MLFIYIPLNLTPPSAAMISSGDPVKSIRSSNARRPVLRSVTKAPPLLRQSAAGGAALSSPSAGGEQARHIKNGLSPSAVKICPFASLNEACTIVRPPQLRIIQHSQLWRMSMGLELIFQK
jgi:hypothetical protein